MEKKRTQMIRFLQILFLMIFVTSCQRNNGHTIRVRNWYSNGTIYNIYIGKTYIQGALGGGKYTDYYPVKTGKHAISFFLPTGEQIKSECKIKGLKASKWTMYISTDGNAFVSKG